MRVLSKCHPALATGYKPEPIHHQAFELNTSVTLLDVSGCGVSPATCSVLVETLTINTT